MQCSFCSNGSLLRGPAVEHDSVQNADASTALANFPAASSSWRRWHCCWRFDSTLSSSLSEEYKLLLLVELLLLLTLPLQAGSLTLSSFKELLKISRPSTVTTSARSSFKLPDVRFITLVFRSWSFETFIPWEVKVRILSFSFFRALFLGHALENLQRTIKFYFYHGFPLIN